MTDAQRLKRSRLMAAVKSAERAVEAACQAEPRCLTCIDDAEDLLDRAHSALSAWFDGLAVERRPMLDGDVGVVD